MTVVDQTTSACERRSSVFVLQLDDSLESLLYKLRHPTLPLLLISEPFCPRLCPVLIPLTRLWDFLLNRS